MLVGSSLGGHYANHLAEKHGLKAVQILLTHEDLADRTRYLNARSTLITLLKLNVVPIINENDTVATSEIRFGDNDTLGALVTNLIEADALIILTDQQGSYTADPRKHADAEFVHEAQAGDPRLEDMAGGAGKVIDDFLDGFFGGRSPDRGPRAGAQKKAKPGKKLPVDDMQPHLPAHADAPPAATQAPAASKADPSASPAADAAKPEAAMGGAASDAPSAGWRGEGDGLGTPGGALAGANSGLTSGMTSGLTSGMGAGWSGGWLSAAALAVLGGAALGGRSAAPAPAPGPAPAPSPQSTRLVLTVSLGPVLEGADLSVDIHDAQGVRLLQVERFRPDANGQMVVDLGVAHSGPVLVRISSAGPNPDYYDEASNRGLNLGCDLRAIIDVAPDRAAAIDVNPFSEVLVRQVRQDAGGQAGQSGVTLPADVGVALASAKRALAGKLGVTVEALDQTPVTIVDAQGNSRTGNALGVALAAVSGYELAAGQSTSQVIDGLLRADRAGVVELMLVGAATDDVTTLQALARHDPSVESALLVGLSAQTVASLPPAAVANIPVEWLSTGTLLNLSPQQVESLRPAQREAMSPQQAEAVKVALGEVVLNTAPVRDGALPALEAIAEDSAADVAQPLGLNALAYRPGTGNAEASQTLQPVVTAIPSFLTLWRADGRAVLVGDALTIDELRGLRYRTVADQIGSGHVVWTVTDDGASLAPHVNRLVERLAVTVLAQDDAPVRLSPAPVALQLDEDAANGATRSLGLQDLRYGPGGGVDEAGQTLGIRITAVPDGLTLWKADGSALGAGATLTLAELQALGVRTVPDAHGTGTLRWTVTDSGRGTGGHLNRLDDHLDVTLSPRPDAPTLTRVSPLAGLTEDTAAEITHAQLLAAADEADVDGDAISFRVETISTGTLEKWNGTTWNAVTAGTTLLATGEKLRWKAEADATGTVNAFTVKATDGTLASDTAVQVKATVTGVNDAPTLTAISPFISCWNRA